MQGVRFVECMQSVQARNEFVGFSVLLVFVADRQFVVIIFFVFLFLVVLHKKDYLCALFSTLCKVERLSVMSAVY